MCMIGGFMENKYYVYLHKYMSGPKAGQVFYVGKGSGNRAYITHNRSQVWRRKSNKYGHTVELYKAELPEVCAYSIEAMMVAYYKSIGQASANLTMGGAGMPHPNNEVRDAISAAGRGRTRSQETKDKTAEKHRGMKRSDQARKNMSEAAKGKVLTKEWREKIGSSQKGKQAGMKHPQVNMDLFKFTHKDGMSETCTMMELRLKYNLGAGNLWNVCYGKAKSHLGWKAEGPL